MFAEAIFPQTFMEVFLQPLVSTPVANAELKHFSDPKASFIFYAVYD